MLNVIITSNVIFQWIVVMRWLRVKNQFYDMNFARIIASKDWNKLKKFHRLDLISETECLEWCTFRRKFLIGPTSFLDAYNELSACNLIKWSLKFGVLKLRRFWLCQFHFIDEFILSHRWKWKTPSYPLKLTVI